MHVCLMAGGWLILRMWSSTCRCSHYCCMFCRGGSDGYTSGSLRAVSFLLVLHIYLPHFVQSRKHSQVLHLPGHRCMYSWRVSLLLSLAKRDGGQQPRAEAVDLGRTRHLAYPSSGCRCLCTTSRENTCHINLVMAASMNEMVCIHMCT